jgi:parallel beta-helix repeat protein
MSLWKKGGFFLTVVLLIGTSVCQSTAILVTIADELPLSLVFYSDNGFSNTLHVGGTGSHNYTTIQEAIRNANEGDTIFVWDDSSPYYEHIVIDKKITLLGENKNTTIIDGVGSGNVVDVVVDKASIYGFKIQNSGRDWIDAGIRISSDHITISGNIITNNECGIYSYNLDDSCIYGNIIANNNHHGIYLPFSSNITIFENTVMDNDHCGIYLYDSSVNSIYGSNISENVITNNMYGIYLWYSFRSNIFRNTIVQNCKGISLNHHSQSNTISSNIITYNVEDGIFLNYSSNNDICRNNISDSKYGIRFFYSSNNNIYDEKNISANKYGLSLNYSNDNNLYKTNCIDNMYGISLNGSSHNNIEWSNILNNHQIGIHISMNSNFNKILSNNFIENYIHASFVQSFNNEWKYNYWDDWSGTGFQKINGEIYLLGGFLSLNWFNFDLHPIKRPYEI